MMIKAASLVWAGSLKKSGRRGFGVGRNRAGVAENSFAILCDSRTKERMKGQRRHRSHGPKETLSIGYSAMDIVQWTLSNGHCPMGIVQWTLSNGHCPMDIVKWTLSNEHCLMGIVQWTLSNEQARGMATHSRPKQ